MVATRCRAAFVLLAVVLPAFTSATCFEDASTLSFPLSSLRSSAEDPVRVALALAGNGEVIFRVAPAGTPDIQVKLQRSAPVALPAVLSSGNISAGVNVLVPRAGGSVPNPDQSGAVRAAVPLSAPLLASLSVLFLPGDASWAARASTALAVSVLAGWPRGVDAAATCGAEHSRVEVWIPYELAVENPQLLSLTVSTANEGGSRYRFCPGWGAHVLNTPEKQLASSDVRCSPVSFPTAGAGPSCTVGGAGSDFTPTSPAMSATNQVPAHTWRLGNASKWWWLNEWSWNVRLGRESTAHPGVNDVFVVDVRAWNPRDVYVIQRDAPLPGLRGDIPLTYQVLWEMAGASTNALDIVSVVVGILPENVTQNWDSFVTMDNTIWVSQVVVNATVVGSLPTAGSTTWHSLSASFRYPSGFAFGSRLVIKIVRSGSTGNVDRYYMRNMLFVRPTTTTSDLTGIPTVSEVYEILQHPTPSPAATQRTLCPHQRSNLKLWTDTATWSGGVPQEGSAVVLPENTAVLMPACAWPPAGYSSITVPTSSELILDDSPTYGSVGTLTVNGKLWIGSETCRFVSPITLTFTGTQTSVEKGVMAPLSSTMEIHGKLFHPTWTRLAAPVVFGQKHILLQDAVDWHVGQEVVITTTIWRDDVSPQNEVRVIAAVGRSGHLLELDRPLEFYHYAGREYQAEVGLLTRRILLQGNPADSEASRRGGHVLMQGASRVSGVQTLRMGQRNTIARYPLHFHLAGNRPTNYITDCSVVRSFYRCVVIHGTHNVTVRSNVAFDAAGSCFYIEDGVEEDNRVHFNLAAYIHVIGTPSAGGGQEGTTTIESSTVAQPADTSAAGFYITNAWNSLVGNAASGGWTGFSFPMLPRPIGQFAVSRASFDPSSRPIKEWNGNSAHSSGYYWSRGSCVYVGGRLTERSSDGLLEYTSGRFARETRWQIPGETASWQSPPMWMIFKNTRVFLCQRGFNHWGSRVEIHGYEAADITRAATLFGDALLSRALIVGRSQNQGVDFTYYQGFQFYDTWVKTMLNNVTFRSYHPGPTPWPGWTPPNENTTVVDALNPPGENGVLLSMVHSDVFKPQAINAVQQLRFENLPASFIVSFARLNTGASRFFNVIDFGGSVSGRGHDAIIGSYINWWNVGPDCAYSSLWDVWICDKHDAQRGGPREVVHMDLRIPGNTNMAGESVHFAATDANKIGYVARFGSPLRSTPITRNNGITGISGEWYVYLKDGAPVSWEIDASQLPNGTHVLLAMRYPAGSTFTVSMRYQWNNLYTATISAASSRVEVLQDPNGHKYYFDGTHLYLKVINPVNTQRFMREGMWLWDIQQGFLYSISASCSSCTAQAGSYGGGSFYPVAAQLPSAMY